MKIYVATHKKAEVNLPNNYEYIQVNAEKNGSVYNLADNIGSDNISVKNANYCELTAAYWVWKNDKENDIVGLAHYRRFLTTNKFSSSTKKFVNSPKVEKILTKYDFIATKKYKTKITVKEHLLVSVCERDFDILEKVIKEDYPEYLSAFNTVFNGKESYLLNMFICKKELWDKYYEWLFSVFDKMENFVDMTGYSVQEQRLYGFLSERLFSVYVLKQGFKVKSFPTHIVGRSLFNAVYNKIARILFKKY
ncbi:MAG: DUF4422 domain-containing protein [Clostridia bacterium]|nr:DUF4422 domain-containing protein [Clostridia bacterium]